MVGIPRSPPRPAMGPRTFRPAITGTMALPFGCCGRTDGCQRRPLTAMTPWPVCTALECAGQHRPQRFMRDGDAEHETELARHHHPRHTAPPTATTYQ